MRAFAGDELLGLSVRHHGLQLGRLADLLLDRDARRVLGFDVICGDEEHRFLPLPTAVVSDEMISVGSPLVLLEGDELDFYRSRALALSSVRGRLVERNRRALGLLRDVVVGPDGTLVALVLEVDGMTRRIPFDSTLRFAAQSRSAA